LEQDNLVSLPVELAESVLLALPRLVLLSVLQEFQLRFLLYRSSLRQHHWDKAALRWEVVLH